MPIRTNIPEASEIRRLAGALSSVFEVDSTLPPLRNFNLSVSAYFTEFPWTRREKRSKSAKVISIESVTVGQYFATFPWRPKGQVARIQKTEIDQKTETSWSAIHEINGDTKDA